MINDDLGSIVARTVTHTVLTLALYAFGIVLIGLALYPPARLCAAAWAATRGLPLSLSLLWLSLAAAAGYFAFGLSLLVLAGAVSIALGLRLKPGVYPLASWGAVRWFVANALVSVVSILFGRFILLTPFASLFYRLMGAKLGGNVQINSDFCADLSLLEIGHGAVIGGHATVIGHVFKRNSLVLKPVKIGNHAVIGLNAIVLPGAVIGDGAIIAAGVTVPMDTHVPPRTVYAGPPAKPEHVPPHDAVEQQDG